MLPLLGHQLDGEDISRIERLLHANSHRQHFRTPYLAVDDRLSVGRGITCNFCGICASKCPSQCISVQKKAATWTYNPFACVYCGVCVEVCPQESLHQERGYKAAVLALEIVTIVGETKEPRPNGRGF